MPRWVERRGYTLQVPTGDPAGDPSGPPRFVRLSLMERVGLVRGLFNVREARAEPGPEGDEVRLLAAGRALSWRWLGAGEAERLLDERLGTLRTMGYRLLDSEIVSRGRWDWLYELVHHRLQRAQADEGPAGTASAGEALREALTRLGLSPDAVIEGVAAVLRISPHALAEPDSDTVRGGDPEELAVLLPFLVHHERLEVRSIGERWLRCAPLPYQLPARTVVTWLESDDRIAACLGPRLEAEGLAMLGPDAMARLARTGRPAVREAAQRWAARLG